MDVLRYLLEHPGIIAFGVLLIIGIWVLLGSRKNIALQSNVGEVDSVIRILQKEKLVLRHNNGDEQTYSFSQVFFAIADKLSIGYNSGSSGFDIDRLDIVNLLGHGEAIGWYIPNHKSVTHLAGMLIQYSLIEPRHKDYQGSSQDRQKVGDVYLPTGTYHTVKYVRTTYYLSSLGSKVVRQLRQQSTAGTKGQK